MTANEVSAWVELAKSRNPVYRYASLLTFDRVSVKPEQKLAFYRQCFEETDPTLSRLIVDKVSSLSVAGRNESLVELRDRATQKGVREVAAYAEEALQRLDEKR